ncbi:LssY C-terminal domain-containing protein [Anatilimnocola sp. NA78]|uniref:LssY C-terminal domain-containing protein n=1 Tax=Anatilimnocola sp. NA78 TaxID=3415683 RepID=UPI003CE4A7ED
MNEDREAIHDEASPANARFRGWHRPVIVFCSIVGAYVLLAYVLLPLLWVRYAHHHPALDETPGITKTGDDHPGDPINVALIGSEEEVKSILKAAGWFPADALGLKSDLKIAAATVLKRPYADAPVSNLFLFGRKEDLAFEQPVGDSPQHRHHVRFWKSAKLDEQKRPLWVGSATYDRSVGVSHTTGQITHHIASDVDAERDHLFSCLEETGRLANVQTIPDFHSVRSGRNGGGDLWKTDGGLLQGTIENVAFP